MSWQEFAACAGKPTALFFPDHGNGASAAKRICATCPVVAECRDEGMHVAYGIWAGLTEAERFGRGQEPKMKLRTCRECGCGFMSSTPRPTCDECRARIRRETWRLSSRRLRDVS